MGDQRRPERQPKCRAHSRREHGGDWWGERSGNIYLSRDQSGAQSGAKSGAQSFPTVHVRDRCDERSGSHLEHGRDWCGERSGNISLGEFSCHPQPRHHCHQGHQGHSYDQEQNILGQISPLWNRRQHCGWKTLGNKEIWLFCILYRIRYCLKYHPLFIDVTAVTPTIFIFRAIIVERWRRQKG